MFTFPDFNYDLGLNDKLLLHIAVFFQITSLNYLVMSSLVFVLRYRSVLLFQQPMRLPYQFRNGLFLSSILRDIAYTIITCHQLITH